ncbi:MAG TPA: hypothetical protein VGN35_02530 [Jatrophihabitantaceae bacterium]|jgi:hypothetical protein|nr:hypothetical protein [Jatrophihabitantaceae bacterium]
MHLSDHVSHVRGQLRSAAALGDERTQHIAESLADTIGPAVQLAVVNALSAAADEITAALLDTPGSPVVTVSLDSDDVRIDVRSSAGTEPAESAGDEGDATARISLRLSEALKGDIDAAARRDGVSVNTWLVRTAARAAARQSAHGLAQEIAQDALRRAGSTHRITGWING